MSALSRGADPRLMAKMWKINFWPLWPWPFDL